MSSEDHETLREAMRLLAVEPGDSWEQVRQRYRERLMATHPDVADTESSARTDEIVDAFRLLREHTDDGIRALPAVVDLSADDGTPAPLVLYARPGDVLLRLSQAAHQIGHIGHIDHASNMLQIIVDDPGWATSQLTAEITPEDDCSSVLFSLEPVGLGTPPPIAEVVGKLAAALRAPGPPS